MHPSTGLTFRKSSYSGARGDNCVEVADAGEGHAAVRDPQNPDQGHFLLPSSDT